MQIITKKDLLNFDLEQHMKVCVSTSVKRMKDEP